MPHKTLPTPCHGVVAAALWLACSLSVQAAVIFNDGVVVFADGAIVDGQTDGPREVAADNATYAAAVPGSEGAVALFYPRGEESPGSGFIDLDRDPSITVNGGSTLDAGGYLGGALPRGHVGPIIMDTDLARINVDGAGSTVLLGTGPSGTGTLNLNGKTDMTVSGGGVVSWAPTNNCTAIANECNVVIGGPSTLLDGSTTFASNSFLTVDGAGSAVLADQPGSRIFVGREPAPFDPTDPDAGSNGLFITNGGLVTGGSMDVGQNNNSPGWNGSDASMGVVVVDGGTLALGDATGNPVTIDMGEGDGGSGVMVIRGGGSVSVDSAPGAEASFYLGQSDTGAATEGGSNLLIVDGPGSTFSVDNNTTDLSGSRVVNGQVLVQDGGRIEVSDSVMIFTGKDGQTLADGPHIPGSLDFLGYTGADAPIDGLDLHVRSGGEFVVRRDNGALDPALILGQAPLGEPDAAVDVLVEGAGSLILVDYGTLGQTNAIGDEGFGLPLVSSLGNGTVTLTDSGELQVVNGFFVVGVQADDNALLTIDSGASLTADQLIIGAADTGGGSTNLTGQVTLNNGTVNGDVRVENKGLLNGSGTINGSLTVDGGQLDIGFSPGTLIVDELIVTAGTELRLQVGLAANGEIDFGQSDRIIATGGDISIFGDLVLDLFALDPLDNVADLLDLATTPLNVGNLFAVTAGRVLDVLPDMVAYASGGSTFDPATIPTLANASFAPGAAPVPAPAPVLLLLAGLLGLTGIRRKTRAQRSAI